MEKWKAKNASHFSTPPTAATSHIDSPSRYTNNRLVQNIGQATVASPIAMCRWFNSSHASQRSKVGHGPVDIAAILMFDQSALQTRRPHMRITHAALLLLSIANCVSVRHLAAQPQWSVKQLFHTGGEGGWDYISVDAASHRLFVTRNTHTLVLDADSGKTLADIPGQKSAHGVAVVPPLNRGFITDGGGTGAILVFDLKTYSVLGKLAAVPDADGIIYDAGSNLILVTCGDSGALLAFRPDVDPETGKIGAPIDLGGKPEFLAADGQGKAYVNLEDKDVVGVVDLNARKVLSKWPVAPGGHPVGLSIDAKMHRLFVGCRNPQKLVVMNTADGKVEASIPIGAGVDATAFSEGLAFVSCRDGSLIVAGENGGKFGLIQTVKTPDGARTLAADAKTHRIYLPTAEFESVATGRPKAKSGTFMIVVVERH
jgi:hypothetical protein